MGQPEGGAAWRVGLPGGWGWRVGLPGGGAPWGVGQSWGWGSLGVEVVGVGFWQYSPIDVCVFLLANIFGDWLTISKRFLKWAVGGVRK